LSKSIKTSEDLGKVIRERRKAAKLTQKKAAALAGIGVRFLSELERGKPTAQIGKTLKVAQLLGLEIRINER
jgi:y4mF family transcriptional regulator